MASRPCRVDEAERGERIEAGAEAERKTLALPAILSPCSFRGGTCPSPRR